MIRVDEVIGLLLHCWNMYCHLSRKGREGSFVVDADERCGRGRSAIVGASVATSSTGAASSFTTPAPAAATTGGRAVKASVDLEIDLFFLLGASFGRGLCLNKVCKYTEQILKEKKCTLPT